MAKKSQTSKTAKHIDESKYLTPESQKLLDKYVKQAKDKKSSKK